ncbi:MAG TPA: 2Fe-2S iron-sulfur cluster-binding protein, partial [Planctomycetota bacterium]|nr:2Fe-2S iron-sulfur cluster-binding protein [Planctomycetota bacterium]
MTTAPAHAYNVRFLPSGKAAAVPAGASLRDAAALAAVPLPFPCGGAGRCLNCRVRIVDGLAAVSDWDRRAFSAADIERGHRLACRLAVFDDLAVECPTEAVT